VGGEDKIAEAEGEWGREDIAVPKNLLR